MSCSKKQSQIGGIWILQTALRIFIQLNCITSQSQVPDDLFFWDEKKNQPIALEH